MTIRANSTPPRFFQCNSNQSRWRQWNGLLSTAQMGSVQSNQSRWRKWQLYTTLDCPYGPSQSSIQIRWIQWLLWATLHDPDGTQASPFSHGDNDNYVQLYTVQMGPEQVYSVKMKTRTIMGYSTQPRWDPNKSNQLRWRQWQLCATHHSPDLLVWGLRSDVV